MGIGGFQVLWRCRQDAIIGLLRPVWQAAGRELRSMDIEGAASLPPAELIDPFGRAISYLRVSVTDRCDFRCIYCMSENMHFLPKQELLTLEELDRLCGA